MPIIPQWYNVNFFTLLHYLNFLSIVQFLCFYTFLYILVEIENVKISVKKTYYFSVEIFCKNKASVRKAETFKRAKNVQSIKIK